MKKILLILLLVSWLDAHSRLVLKNSYKYYNLGYDYYKTINNLKKSREVCIDVVGTPYMNPIYKDSCLLGVEDSEANRDKMKLESFLNSSIHKP